MQASFECLHSNFVLRTLLIDPVSSQINSEMFRAKLLLALLVMMKLFTALRSNFCNPHARKFNYLLLNLQWPATFPTYNRRADRQAIRDHYEKFGYLFTIHGLWPQINGWGPTRCNHSDPFDLNLVQSIPDIDRYWTSFAMPTPNFWKYEWSKHGTCAANLERLNSVKDYFEFSVDRAREFDSNVYKKLNEEFSPSNRSISSSAFKNLVETLHKYKVDLRCRGNLISDIQLCYDLDLRPIDCEHFSNCNRQVQLPAQW